MGKGGSDWLPRDVWEDSSLLRDSEEPECDDTSGLLFDVLVFVGLGGPKFSASPNGLKCIKIDTDTKDVIRLG